ncbi:MAG: hypothetical protein CMP93_06855 [Gammaproteobacteria bacterium]|nr:hypothetical protein [Gammaproteobacteria bacterium]|tara:strand:- start:440 stop:808 length:369 start_codon:yes stop_codon:yes gene_type:complete
MVYFIRLLLLSVSIGFSVIAIAGEDSEEFILLNSVPAIEESLPGLKVIRLWFSKVPDPERSSIELEFAGETIETHSLHTMGEKDLMSFVRDELEPGPYKLFWTASDQYDRLISGEIKFDVYE